MSNDPLRKYRHPPPIRKRPINTIRYCQIGIPGPRRRGWWRSRRLSKVKRRYVLTFFQKLPPSLIGIEACSSSHYWSRELGALGHNRSSETGKQLDEIPGVGPALATALVASIADLKVFRSARDFSAWIGLVPKQHSSGGKDKLGSISKQPDLWRIGC